MGNQIITVPFDLYVAGSKAATFGSTPVQGVGLVTLAIQQIITGASSLAGNAKIQVSNDKVVSSIVNWDDYSGSQHNFTGNESFSWMIYQPLSALWLRLLVTITAGSGTFAATGTGTRTIT